MEIYNEVINDLLATPEKRQPLMNTVSTTSLRTSANGMPPTANSASAITCESTFPEGCSTCSFCLNTVLQCPDRQTTSPSIAPSFTSSPTETASQSPTLLSPTSSPSDRLTSKPMTSFDIADCDSYSSAWRFELIVEGKCTSAAKLFERGDITCESTCPEGCTMCIFA